MIQIFARLIAVTGLVSLTFCGGNGPLLDELYGPERPGGESVLFDQQWDLDGLPGPERVVLASSNGAERLGFLKKEGEAWKKVTSMEFNLGAVSEPGQIEGARIVRRIVQVPTGPDDPDSVLVEYASEDPEVEGVTGQLFVFTRMVRTFDSLTVSGFSRYEETIAAAGGVPYRIEKEGLTLFPDSKDQTDILPLRYNGRSFAWVHDDGPFFYMYPLEASREEKRLKGRFKFVNRGADVKNVRVFVEMPSRYGGPGALRDLELFEPRGTWEQDETQTFDFNTRYPKEPPVLLVRIVAGKKDQYEYPARGETADRVVKKKGDLYYKVPVIE